MTDKPEVPTEFDPPVDAQFTGLTPLARRDLVDLTTSDDPAAALVSVAGLELTALGANAQFHGAWNSKIHESVLGWNEEGQQGRVTKSVTTGRGYLFPLGHHAEIISTVVRAIGIEPTTKNYPVAYLQQVTTIKVTEPNKTYPAIGQPFPLATGGTTDWPFVSVRMTTLEATNLDSESKGSDAIQWLGDSRQARWITSGGDPILWHFVATDAVGNAIAFAMPLVFVAGYDRNDSNTVNEFGDNFHDLIADYVSDTVDMDKARYSKVGGAKIRFAQESTGEMSAGQTTHPTLLFELGAATTTYDPNLSGGTSNSTHVDAGADDAALATAGQPNFYPTMRSARVRLHAPETLKAGDFDDVRPKKDSLPAVGGVQIAYYPDYVEHGASTYPASANDDERDDKSKSKKASPDASVPNPGAVFAHTVNPTPLNLPSGQVGGVGTPNVGVTGLSGNQGCVGGDLDHYAQKGQADLASYFPVANTVAGQAVSKLLGCLSLGDILDPDQFPLPTISSQVDAATGLPVVTYSLTAPLRVYGLSVASDAPLFVPDGFDPDDPTTTPTNDALGNPPSMYLKAVFTPVPGSKTPSFQVSGSIDPFTVYLLGYNSVFDFIHLHFEAVNFGASTGQATSVTVNLDEVKFDGVLAFVNPLQDYLKNLGYGNLTTSVEPTQIVISASVNLPMVECGYFNLTGISFQAGVNLPFIDGIATATFSFATPENMFTLTACCFGGSGYVSLSLNFGGVQSVAASFGVSGQLALDLGVAAGSVTLTLGISFMYSPPNPADDTSGLVLGGFVHVVGQVQVLGIVTITASLELSLSYVPATNTATGQVTVIVSIAIGFFTVPIPLQFSKSIQGPPVPGITNSAAKGIHAHADGDPSTPLPLTFPNMMMQQDWTTYCGAFG